MEDSSHPKDEEKKVVPTPHQEEDDDEDETVANADGTTADQVSHDGVIC